jgi:Uncharacterized protein conserved in bacteria
MKMEILKVSANSNVKAVAGAVTGEIRSNHKCEVQAIGASAVNQAVKAIAIARGYVATQGFDIVCIPSMIEVEVGGEKRTAIRFFVEV